MNMQKLLKYLAGFIAFSLVALAVFVAASWVIAEGLQRYSHDWDASSATGQWAGAIVTLAGFAFVIVQLFQDRKELENHTRELASQTTWMVYSNGLTTLNVFVEHPELRPYFYDDNLAVPTQDDESNQWLRSRIFAAAEMLADHWESTFLADDMNRNVNELWLAYMMSIYCRSPALREFLHQGSEGYRYSKAFRELLEGCDCTQLAQVKAGKLPIQELCSRQRANLAHR